jgi:hypothetical protein
VKNDNAGNYTLVEYDSGQNANLYQVHIKASNGVAAGDIDSVQFIGILTGVGSGTLTGANFTRARSGREAQSRFPSFKK